MSSETYNLTTSLVAIAPTGCPGIHPAHTMKFQPDVITTQFVQAYGPDWVQVANERLYSSVVLDSNGVRFAWNCQRFADLSAAHFEQLAQLQPELVLFGSGTRLRFPAAALTRALIERQIGLETMDVAAACRTYNVLAGEGRRVVVALLLESVTD